MRQLVYVLIAAFVCLAKSNNMVEEAKALDEYITAQLNNWAQTNPKTLEELQDQNLEHHEHHSVGCKHDEFTSKSPLRSLMYSKETLQKFGNYTSTPQPPSMKRQASDVSPIRIFVNYSLLDTDVSSCRQPGGAVYSPLAFSDPATGLISNTYTCQQGDVITTDKKSLIQNYIMPFVVSILKYLVSVVPEQGNLVLDRNFHDLMGRTADGEYTCREGIPIPSHLFDQGEPATDFYLIVTARPVPFERKVLADAFPCSHRIYGDQWGSFYGRPLVASINFNPGSLLLDQISVAILHDQFRTHQLVMLGLHEMIHALGFTANLYSHFVNDEGVRYGPNGPVVTLEKPGAPRTRMVVSPRVVKFAQFHYQCATMKGVELEGRDYGSHWEERIAGDELMSPLTTRVMPLSALTLALLQDSGWYQVNFASAQRWRWGWHRGCDFVSKPCSESSWGDLYCSDNQLRCNQERSSKAQCNSHNNPVTDAHLYYMDGCPTLKSFSNRGFCQDLTSTFAMKTNANGETFGDNSNCYDVRQFIGAPISPACFQTRCISNSASNRTQLIFYLFDKWYGCPSSASASLSRDTWVEVKHPSLPGGFIQVMCPSYPFFCENEAVEPWILAGSRNWASWYILAIGVLFFVVY